LPSEAFSGFFGKYLATESALVSSFTFNHAFSRDFVHNKMYLQDSKGFVLHEPTAHKVVWGILHSLGPNHEWSANGHDKLTPLGFAIWGI
jgi:hypothetical protein